MQPHRSRRCSRRAAAADSAAARGAAAGRLLLSSSRTRSSIRLARSRLLQRLPPPRLFHEEMQPNYGLMVAGLVILGASWSINAASAYLADEWKLAVPVVGPFMETQNIYTGPGYDDEPLARRPARLRRPHRDRRRHHARRRRA